MPTGGGKARSSPRRSRRDGLGAAVRGKPSARARTRRSPCRGRRAPGAARRAVRSMHPTRTWIASTASSRARERAGHDVRDARRRAHAEERRDSGLPELVMQRELFESPMVEAAEVRVRHAGRERRAHDRHVEVVGDAIERRRRGPRAAAPWPLRRARRPSPAARGGPSERGSGRRSATVIETSGTNSSRSRTTTAAIAPAAPRTAILIANRPRPGRCRASTDRPP